MVFKRIVRAYFTFNQRERRGVFVLVVILLILAGVHTWLRLNPVEPRMLSAPEIAAIDALAKQVEEAGHRHATKEAEDTTASSPAKPAEVQWHRFDPNTVSEAELQSLGLDKYKAGRWVKYRNSGGSFNDPGDVSRLYGMDPSWLAQAQAYMVFPRREERVLRQPQGLKDGEAEAIAEGKQPPPLDLNTADSMMLVGIRGIGPYYASRIVRLREELGGYTDFDQLNDIYRMRSETLERLRKSTFIDETKIRKLSLNTVNAQTLAEHKYIDWKIAKILVAYREAHGPYGKTEDILRTDVISQDLYLKIAPYLSIE